MAFKMKGPSLYKNGASLKVQKDYAGQADGRATSSPLQQKEDKKEEKNEWGETPKQYKKRMEEMGLRKPEKKAPPVKSPVKQKDYLDVQQQKNEIASSDIDLEEKRQKAAVRQGKRARKNRSRIVGGPGNAVI